MAQPAPLTHPRPSDLFPIVASARGVGVPPAFSHTRGRDAHATRIPKLSRPITSQTHQATSADANPPASRSRSHKAVAQRFFHWPPARGGVRSSPPIRPPDVLRSIRLARLCCELRNETPPLR